MKKAIFLLFSFIPLLLSAQTAKIESPDSFIFKEIKYYDRLTRNLTDTSISFYNFNIPPSYPAEPLIISQLFTALNTIQEINFIKFKFIKQNDSLFIHFFNPSSHEHQNHYLYPLNKRDTLENCKSYKMCIDTFFGFDKKVDDTYNEPCFKTYYSKDTTILFKEHSFNCYVIGQDYHYKKRLTNIHKEIFIDKKRLVPVYEVEYTFTKEKWRLIPTNQWIKTREMKLISIE